jgi:RNA polymerase sporulation-specific sigma factor
MISVLKGGVVLKLTANAETPIPIAQCLMSEIIKDARSGDDKALEHLINKYKSFVRAKARTYFLIGADRKT